MAYSTLKAFVRVTAIAFGSVSLTAVALQSMLGAVRAGFCSGLTCDGKTPLISPGLANQSPPDRCVVTTLLLARRSSRTIRDQLLLLGQKDSIAEYILPLMHLSKYDPSLSDPSFSRQGLSAVKYGLPLSIPNSELRLLLFKLGLADAVVVSPSKISSSLDPLTIKYRFRLQPYIHRLKLPAIPPGIGISEDSEVLQQHIASNPNLFDQDSYSCL